MSQTTFQALKDKQDPLVTAPLNSLVLAHPWSAGASYIPSSLTDSSGKLQALSQGWLTLGELQKKAGVDMTPSAKTSDIEGLGSMAPRRTVFTSRGLDIDFTAQEWRKVSMEIFNQADLSSVYADPTSGEWRGHVMAQPYIYCWSLLVIAFDGVPGSEVYPFWVFPKTTCTKMGKQSLVDGSEITFPSTMTVYEDSAYTSSDGTVGPLWDFGVAGVGNVPLAKLAGFMDVTSITVSPATATLTHSPVETQQLTVTDSNGVDVTVWSSFSSATPADATVDANGLVTAVATGSSVITASYTPSGHTVALTGTCTVTVS